MQNRGDSIPIIQKIGVVRNSPAFLSLQRQIFHLSLCRKISKGHVFINHYMIYFICVCWHSAAFLVRASYIYVLCDYKYYSQGVVIFALWNFFK